MPKHSQLLTAQELAAALHLTVNTVWRYTRDRRIPYVELGSRQYRYDQEAVLRALSPTPAERVGQSSSEGPDSAPQKKLSFADWQELPDEPGYQQEIIDGTLCREPSPSRHHQRVSQRLQRLVADYFAETDPLGEVLQAPLDVVLDAYTVVQPDLLYLPGTVDPNMDPISTAPFLAVEILSPHSIRRDRVLKTNRYRQAGVTHYWIVDPDQGAVEAYSLEDGRYVLKLSSHTTFDHPDFPGLTFNMEALCARPPTQP